MTTDLFAQQTNLFSRDLHQGASKWHMILFFSFSLFLPLSLSRSLSPCALFFFVWVNWMTKPPCRNCAIYLCPTALGVVNRGPGRKAQMHSRGAFCGKTENIMAPQGTPQKKGAKTRRGGRPKRSTAVSPWGTAPERENSMAFAPLASQNGRKLPLPNYQLT